MKDQLAAPLIPPASGIAVPDGKPAFLSSVSHFLSVLIEREVTSYKYNLSQRIHRVSPVQCSIP